MVLAELVLLVEASRHLVLGELVAAGAALLAASVETVIARMYPRAVALDLPLLVSSAVVGVVVALGAAGFEVWSAAVGHWAMARTALPLTAALVVLAVWAIVPVRRADLTGCPGRGGREGIWWWW
jgi:Na+/glutamate symporter